MKIYEHKVCYYETDKMGITHHSNYIRWMEEARIDFLDQIGFGYAFLEEKGIISPVVSVNCNYKKPTTFDDVVVIGVKIKKFSGVRLTIEYIMNNKKTNENVCIATSEHCFVDESGTPIRLDKVYPEFNEVLKKLAEMYK